MTRQKVTDPALLAQLGQSPRKKVTDPQLLAQLNADNGDEEDAGAYLDNLPEPEGFWHKLPKNILTGLTHAGRNLHNLPYDLSKLAEWPVEKLIGPLKHPLSSYLPYDEKDYSDVFGTNKETNTLMDKLIQGGIEHAPELIGGAGLVRGGFRRLKGTHQLDAVEKAIKQKGLQDFAYPKEMIEEAKKFLPETKATKELLGQVNTGKYGPAFDLQSQVGHHQRNLLRSPLASENSIMAPKAGELKQNMLDHLERVLRSANHIEEADMMRKGINNYKRYKKIMKVAIPLFKKLKIPTSGLAALGLGVYGGKKLVNKLMD